MIPKSQTIDTATLTQAGLLGSRNEIPQAPNPKARTISSAERMRRKGVYRLYFSEIVPRQLAESEAISLIDRATLTDCYKYSSLLEDWDRPLSAYLVEPASHRTSCRPPRGKSSPVLPGHSRPGPASPADWLPKFSPRRPQQKTSDVDASSCRGRSDTVASKSCSTSLPAPARAVPSYPVPMPSPRRSPPWIFLPEQVWSSSEKWAQRSLRLLD